MNAYINKSNQDTKLLEAGKSLIVYLLHLINSENLHKKVFFKIK